MATSQILEFYNNANVFITGGTGFLGKILIEKLLRSTSVSTIYILVRSKKGRDTEARIKALFEDVIFQKLHQECPKFIHRIVGINGDVSLADLGISQADRKTLIDKVDIIFHGAATVRFDENLKISYNVNVNGARSIIDLGREMKNLKSLIHVSTAFSNCHLTDIDEKFYEYPVDYKEVGMILDKLSESEAHTLTPRIIGAWPNTYTFTKALAESMIKEFSGDIPVGLFRPSIVISTFREPTEGWIDNLYGPTGVIAGATSGLLRVLYCNKHKQADMVPVDMCVAAMIAAAWDTSQKSTKLRTPEDVPIYNYVSGHNSINWEEYSVINTLYNEHYPLMRCIWTPFLYMTNNAFLYAIMKIFFHYLPALLLDCISILSFRKTRMLSMYKKIHKFSNVIDFFSAREWHFSNDNIIKLWTKLEEQDRKTFYFDMETLDWWKYYKNYLLGIRKYIMKESVDTIQSAKRKKLLFDVLHKIFVAAIYFMISVLCWTFLQSFQSNTACISHPR